MDAFKWSTPAPNIDGTIPKPWRVASSHAALDIMHELGFADGYTVHESKRFRGAVQMFVGLRSGPARRKELHDALKAAGYRVRMNRGEVMLVDKVKA